MDGMSASEILLVSSAVRFYGSATIMTKLQIIAVILLVASLAQAQTLTVKVTTEGPREGAIDILVFSGKDGFPDKPDRAFRRAIVPVTAEGPVVCAITNLPYGEYSLSVLHDINKNSKADKLLGFGPPREPVGFSNIARKLLKPPTYESTTFAFSSQSNETSVALWYAY